MRPRASPGRACRRRLRLVGRPGTRRATRGTSSGSSCLAASSSSGSAAAACAQIQLDLAVQELQPGTIQRVQRAGGRAREQPQRFLGAAGQLLAGGGFQRAVRPASRVGRERRRSLQERSGRREPTSRAGALGRLLQLARDVLIGPCDRVRAMPGPAIGIEARDRWLPPAPDARRAARRAAPPGRSPSAGADGET